MITWLLLLSLFCQSIQDENDQEHGVLQCGPQNVTLTSSGQTILSTWKDTPSCFAVRDVLIYELVVLIADKQVHYDEVAVLPDQIGSTHSWNWTSYLALECAPHAVRLRSPYKKHTSQWKPEQTLPGKKKQTGIFPKDKWFQVGSTVTFCCVLPVGQVFKEMYLTGYSSANMNTTKISSHVYALTVHLNQASTNSCTNVICGKINANRDGACAYIGYPPNVSDLQCETRDLESVECHWREGGDTDITINNPTVYQLLGSPCTKLPQERCSQNFQVDVGERNWTFTAENKFGKVELSDTADLTKRVHMSPPEAVTASAVNARDVRLEWEWTAPQYQELNISCQVSISHDTDTTVRSELFGVGLKFAVLNDMIPNWTYNVRVRCGTAQHFWKWSEWSTSVTFHTKGDVPDALDVWMQRKDDQILTIWKIPLANQSHGHIQNYEVTWTKTSERERQNRTEVGPDESSLALSLNTSEEYIVTVTARNMNGSSSPSAIIIPILNPDRTRVNTSRIVGSNGSFKLSWSASPAATCGYVVDWCPSSHCTVDWLKVPPNDTEANIFSKDFRAGRRYSLTIYACTQGAPVLLGKREGYVSEQRIEDGLFKPLKGKQQDSDFEVSWDPISLREQSAFIQGYVLHCVDSNNKVISFSTDNPEVTSLTARNLKISSYTFTVMAKTAVGECGATSFTATLNSLTDNLINMVLISMVTVFGVLSLITVLFYRHWTCIKQKVYPPIPKPVLTVGEHRCRPLHVDQCHYSEADILDVPQLLSASLFNTFIFPNPSYNLMMQHGDQQSSPGPELQEGTSLGRSSGGYQAHSHTESFTVNQTEEAPESPTSYVSTNSLLPH